MALKGLHDHPCRLLCPRYNLYTMNSLQPWRLSLHMTNFVLPLFDLLADMGKISTTAFFKNCTKLTEEKIMKFHFYYFVIDDRRWNFPPFEKKRVEILKNYIFKSFCTFFK